ncbi:Fanconi anemia group A protein isoform X2 [Myripristis murdjan]|uniref:Fanconi anemia group A protein isoform X2 n=1 Tax=Myripristis murdjan TaxID=586833 RepID=UPI001175CB5A|nr:Fanconi anemia group A protein isoform X2 [Myripristis murdjan]
MSLSASCVSVCQKRTVSGLLAGRVVKRPKQEDGQRLQEAVIQLLNQQQSLSSLLREVGSPNPCNIFCSENAKQGDGACEGLPSAIAGSLLVGELRRQAEELRVPVAALSVRMMLERLTEITRTEEEHEGRVLLTSSQRVQLSVLLQAGRELLSLGALCPKLLWQEYWKDQFDVSLQEQPNLEVVFHLHAHNILTLKSILESDEGVRSWLVSELKALCDWTAPQDQQEARQVQQKVLSVVVGVLVGAGFEESQESAAPNRKLGVLCCSVLDDMLSWLLDTMEKTKTAQCGGTGAALWIQLCDASLCGVSVSPAALRRFFTHSLTSALTYKPRLTVSEAIAMQSEWSFAKSNQLLTSFFHKLAVIFSVEELLLHLQQVLETHEVNWQHVLCFLSTLLVYNPDAQRSLRELLSRLLSSAFDSYDLENMITAFLLARQGALEGPGLFPSYCDWFKMSFGGASGYHATSKKSLVFLLKFLSDLVPFDPPQYIKVHILHPPFVSVKHRSLLMEYISLAKTRLADLKVAVEDMGLYEDVSGAAGAPVQPHCQALQDVEKAVSLFETTGRISATVMEASIFRKPYFLTRFLPALLTPRVLPLKADARMRFIEALKKADKIPAAQYSSYVESCQRQRGQQERNVVCVESHDDPQEVLQVQLQEFRGLVIEGNDGEISAQLSRISHTLSVIFPDCPKETIGQKVVNLHMDLPPSRELHDNAVSMILRNFCQCILDASQAKPPNKQTPWACRFVSALLGNTQLLSSLIHRLWDLFHNQGLSLSAAHILGLGAFVVHLQACSSQNPLVQFVPPLRPELVPITEALAVALVCRTHTDMLFCIRLCLAAVCYGICRGDSLPQQQQLDYIPKSLYKKLLYLIPRLLPEARRTPLTGESPEGELHEENHCGLWRNTTDANTTWRKSAWHLWKHAAFRQLVQIPQYQLSFSEWLATELRVHRSNDALPDPDRQEYQQWACMDFYLSCPEEQGGCGGDMRNLCSHILNAVMDQQAGDQNQEKLYHGVSEMGTCLPDILSRLQELLYDMQVSSHCSARRSSADVCDFLFELVSQRCSSALTSDSLSISRELGLQHTLHAWNRVLLALPAVLFVTVTNEGGRTTLDCHNLIEHINQHQRKVCFPAGLLPFHLTAHFLKGVLTAGVRCGRSSEEVNKAWSQISLHCPLLLVSTVHWWERLSPVLLSLWRRLCGGERLPEQLLLLADCQRWACSSEKAVPSMVTSAPALLLAASLHRAWGARGGRRGETQGFSTILDTLKLESHYQQVLVFLLFLCVNDLISTFLYPQEAEESAQRARQRCSEILPLLLDSPDWLLIFKSAGKGPYQSVTMLTRDECTRLMPLAFYSVLLQQRAELLDAAVRAPGFLHTAVLCYIDLLQLFLDRHTPAPVSEPHTNQVEPSQMLSRAQQFLLRAISQSPLTALSSSQLTQLQSLCEDLDPEVAAALALQLGPDSLSQEMDFL